MAWSKIRRATKIRIQAERLLAAADPGSIVPPLRHQLRSQALSPFAQSLAQSGADHTVIVEQVAETRSQILQDPGRYSEPQSTDLRGGRLLYMRGRTTWHVALPNILHWASLTWTMSPVGHVDPDARKISSFLGSSPAYSACPGRTGRKSRTMHPVGDDPSVSKESIARALGGFLTSKPRT
jgi:hypothetical protein